MRALAKRRLILGFALTLCALSMANPARAALGGADAAVPFLAEYVQTLHQEDGPIPVSQVKHALQTSDGHMWFAGYQGLMRYNGTDTRVFTQSDGFATFNVNVLFEDRQQTLWIGTNDIGVARRDGVGFTLFGLEQGLPSASVRDIAEDEWGSIFVSTAAGIAMISPDGLCTPHPELSQTFTTQLEYVGGGQFLCLLSDGTLVRFDSQSVLETIESGRVSAHQPISLFYSRSGVLYIGTSGETVVVTDRDLAAPQRIGLAVRQTLNNFYEDSAGRIWVCADNGLGYFLDGGFVPVDGLLMNNSLEYIFEDHEGGLWVCSSRQGLLQLARSKFTNISFAAGLADYTVNTTAVFDGDLYIGADEGLVIVRRNRPVENELTAMLKDIRVRCMLVDSKGRLWICTYERYGVLMLEPNGRVTSITAADGLASDKVRCILEAADGRMVVGMSGGVSVLEDGVVTRSYGHADGLTSDVILSLCEKDGVLYAGSDGGGIYAIENGQVRSYTEKDGLAAGVILRMAVIGDGIWISTGNAVCYMDASGIRMIDKLMAYDDSVFDIFEIDEKIWFLNSKGIVIGQAANLLSEDALAISQLGRRDGLSSAITANSWNGLSGDGTLYISTGKGVLAVDTRAAYQPAAATYAGLGEVHVDGQPVDFTDGLTLPSGARRVDIQVALLSYATKDGTVSYMLEGFDSEVKTLPRSSLAWVSYTNLKAGKYTFRLYGTSAAGTQSPEIVLPISKAYTPLEMPIIRALLVLAALCVLALSVRFLIDQRTKKIVRQRQAYKEIIEQALSVIAVMADSKNSFTSGHSHRVAEYAKMLGRRLGMGETELENLGYAAMLHDVGRIGIPDRVLDKPTALTSDDYESIKDHVLLGGNILESISILQDISLGARYHHERIDGKGYATGLKGDEIPLIARIISVCDAFDGMLSDRPHRKAMTVEMAQSELIHNAGSQFDAEIVAILISMIDEEVVPL